MQEVNLLFIVEAFYSYGAERFVILYLAPKILSKWTSVWSNVLVIFSLILLTKVHFFYRRVTHSCEHPQVLSTPPQYQVSTASGTDFWNRLSLVLIAMWSLRCLLSSDEF